jgi:hypothetical protein
MRARGTLTVSMLTRGARGAWVGVGWGGLRSSLRVTFVSSATAARRWLRARTMWVCSSSTA